MTQLQLAIDCLDTDTAMDLARKTEPWVDIFEIGTPLLKHEGIGVIRKFVHSFPDTPILVDTKTMDVGGYEAEFCFSEGAQTMTVLGVADDATIVAAQKMADSYGRDVMVDLINVEDKPARVAQLKKMGVRMVGVHSGIDQQHNGETPCADLHEVRGRDSGVPVAVAGGINQDTLPEILAERPDVVVVGGAITGAENPAEEAKRMKEMMG